MTVYIVKFDWSTYDGCDVDLYVYDTYEKAFDKYNELIKNEMNPELSWVGSQAFENGKLQKGYELFEIKRIPETDESEIYWCVENKNDYYQHSYIGIKILEVN